MLRPWRSGRRIARGSSMPTWRGWSWGARSEKDNLKRGGHAERDQGLLQDVEAGPPPLPLEHQAVRPMARLGVPDQLGGVLGRAAVLPGPALQAYPWPA